jgi:hypothetical protein
MLWLATAFCAFYALVVWRLAVRTGRNAFVWCLLGVCAGPLVLPVLMTLKPGTAARRSVRPALLWWVTSALVVACATGLTFALFKRIESSPAMVVARAHVDGGWEPTEPDGPTSFVIAMLGVSATLFAGVSLGGLGGLMLAPPVALAIEAAARCFDEPTRCPPTAVDVGDSRTSPAGCRSSQARRTAARAAAVVGGGAMMLVAAWLIIFGMTFSGAFAALIALGIVLPSVQKPAARRARALLIPGLVLTSVLSWKTPARELRTTLQRLRDKKDQSGASSFSTRDTMGVFGLNVVMGLGGFLAGFPEVASETLSLCKQGPATRTWHSDFAMRSPKVRAELRRFVEFAEHQARSEEQITLPTTRIAWQRYSLSSDSARVALALNSPFELGGTARREGGQWRLDLVGRARAEYPPRSVLGLFSIDGEPVEFDEGLFWVLQKRGWLHPYVAEWRWSIQSDDPRLRDVQTPFLSLRERLWARVLGSN